MSLTIDQQRQRVEQEMTRMVDDLDRTLLRKMQVTVYWRLYDQDYYHGYQGLIDPFRLIRLG